MLIKELLITWLQKFSKQKDILSKLTYGPWELFYTKWSVEPYHMEAFQMIPLVFTKKYKKMTLDFPKVIQIQQESN